jgi:glucokinase
MAVADVVIGVDVGGSGIRAARVLRDGVVDGDILRVTLADPGQTGNSSREDVLEKIVGLVNSLSNDQPITSIGVGLPAFLSQPDGIVTLAPNLPKLTGWEAGDAIKEAINLRVRVDNDANAAAFGEAWAGSGKGQNPFIYLGLGTGVGGGVVLNGDVLHGAQGMAAELGHLTVFADGAPCGCGAMGCLEAYASAVGVCNHYLAASGETVPISAKQIADLAFAGNVHAVAAFELAGRALGIAMGQLVHVFNPAMIALGGGMAAAWELFQAPMQRELAARTPSAMRAELSIRPAALGADAGVIGAAGLAWQSR